MGGWIADTLTIYARVFRRGSILAVRNWPVGLVVLLYGVILSVVFRLAMPFGRIGGFFVYLATVACMSSWLALVEHVIRSGRVQVADLPSSFGAYLADILTVAFVLFLLQIGAALLLSELPVVHVMFLVALFVFLNAVPELIYLGRHGVSELLAESYRFIGENWIEWFPPNIMLSVAIMGLTELTLQQRGAWRLVLAVLLGVLLYFFMIVRGLLFLELSTSSRRARDFQRRAAG